MSRTKKRDPLKNLLVWVLVMAVLAGLAVCGRTWIADRRENALEERIAEVEQANAKAEQEYAVALAEFQQQTASGANLAWPAQKTEGWDIVDLTNYPLESPMTVSVTRQDLMNGGILLVNQWHSRPEDYSESGLVGVIAHTRNDTMPVKCYDGSVKLLPAAISAYQEALTDAAAEGLGDYMIQEAYRSYADQEKLFQNEVDELAKRGKYTGDELLEQAAKSVNYPGTSEYNTGLSFRLRLYNKDDASVGKTTFSTSEQGIWLAQNCWKYGIVFRFQAADFPLRDSTDKSYKTGISTHMNLYRYVGKGNAAVMHIKDFCLEEYVEYLMEHPHIAVFEDGILRYEIYRQNVGDAENITLELTGKTSGWTSSLDNMGGAVTVFTYGS